MKKVCYEDEVCVRLGVLCQPVSDSSGSVVLSRDSVLHFRLVYHVHTLVPLVSCCVCTSVRYSMAVAEPFKLKEIEILKHVPFPWSHVQVKGSINLT